MLKTRDDWMRSWREAAFYTRHFGPATPRDVFWSTEIMCAPLQVPPPLIASFSDEVCKPLEQSPQVVAQVVAARRRLVAGFDLPDPTGGRLIIWGGWSTCDGLAEEETRLFDTSDVPAWSTWVGIISREVAYWPVLVAWIPERLVPAAQVAIDIVPVEQLMWLDDFVMQYGSPSEHVRPWEQAAADALRGLVG